MLNENYDSNMNAYEFLSLKPEEIVKMILSKKNLEQYISEKEFENLDPFQKKDSKTIYFILLEKKNEKYFFIYNNKNSKEVLRTFGRYASNKKLSFTWYDAAILLNKVREESLKHLED